MKVHFKMVREPITEWKSPACCACGKSVDHPQPEMMIDVDKRGLPERNSIRDCMPCWRVIEHDAAAGIRFYLYAIISGQEAIAPEEM